MNDKVTFQAISEILASQYGLSKKSIDAFGRVFFETIVDVLNTEGALKIKGLGTFKIVEVGSRESVDVNNGEHIIIDGYRKVSFTPVEFAKQKQKKAIADVEMAVAEAGNQAVENEMKQVAVPAQLEDEANEDAADEVLSVVMNEDAADEVQSVVMNEDVETNKVEVPVDQFSGIDLLISTPESICEVEKDLSLARIRAEQTLEEAKKANVEYRRLEMLLERLKANVMPENVDEVASKASLSAALAAVVSHEEAPISVPLQEPETAEQVQEPETAEQVQEPETAEQVQETESDEQVQEAESAEQVQETETAEPAKEAEPAVQEEAEAPTQDVEAPQTSETDTSGADAENSNLGHYEDDEDEESSNLRLWILIPLVGVLLAVAGIFVYRYLKYDVQVEEPLYENVDEEVPADSSQYSDFEKQELEKIAHADSVKKQEDKKAAETIAAEKKAKEEKLAADKKAAEEKAKAEKEAADKKAAEEKAKAEKLAADKKAAEEKAKKAKEDAAKANKAKVHTMMKGENLYQISKKYYGTYDSVRSIIRINKFPDPNNVPIGQVIKLP